MWSARSACVPAPYGAGNIHIDNKKEDAYKFNVNKLDDIINIIIPHFDKYPLLTSKNLDYQDFKIVAYMMKDGLHLTEEGMKKILLITPGHTREACVGGPRKYE